MRTFRLRSPTLTAWGPFIALPKDGALGLLPPGVYLLDLIVSSSTYICIGRTHLRKLHTAAEQFTAAALRWKLALSGSRLPLTVANVNTYCECIRRQFLAILVLHPRYQVAVC
jgi:hypothetical protein